MPLLRIVFIIAASRWIGAGVVGALLARLAGTGIAGILSMVMMIRALHAAPAPGYKPRTPAQLARLPPERTFWWRFSAYAAMMYVFNLSVYLYNRDFVVLAIPLLLPSGSAAQTIAGLGVAYSLVRQILQALVTPLNGIQVPLYARLHAEQRFEGLRTAYEFISKLLILSLVPVGVGMIVLARNVFILLYLQVNGAAVVNGQSLQPLTLAVAILTVGLFGEAVVGGALQVLMVYEQYRAVVAARLSAVLTIPLLYLLVPRGESSGPRAP